MTGRPLARSQDLIVEELGDEILVYDERTDRGHCLSSEAARVWRRCDGLTPVDGLSAQLDLDAETVDRALDELESCDLLEATPELTADGGTTRRELTVRMAKVGGAVAAAPMIVSIVAPTAASAFTPPPGCEKLGLCLGDCGQTGHGCKAVTTGCCCCQVPNQQNCNKGDICSFDPNIKFCARDAADCSAFLNGGGQNACANAIKCGAATPCTSAASAQRGTTSTSTSPTTTTPTTTTPTTTTPGTTIPPSTPSTGSTTTPTP